MVGSERDAKRAVDGEMQLLDNSGGHRLVYRDPDAPVVYKIETAEGRRDRTNGHEHANAELFAGHPGVPPTSLYAIGAELVLAMPYYPEPMLDWSGTEEVCAALAPLFGDLNLHNMRRDAAGKVWFIDLATGI